MSCILHIETSTAVCSVALSEDSQVIYHAEEGGRYAAPAADVDGAKKAATPQGAEHLGRMVDDALSFADSHAIPLDAVAVSGGPGSYTGLRIGVSMAKGICFGLGLPLVAVPTLELLCVPVLLGRELPDDALLVPMIDARRMEVYSAVYDRALRPVRAVGADVVTADTYGEWLGQGRQMYFFGNGAAKCMDTIAHPAAHLIEDIDPLARWMQPLAERRLIDGRTEDVAYYEPFYLKDFVAKLPRQLL